MTPPLSIGNQVEVTGPDRYGNDTDKRKFEICMIWGDEGKTFYSDRYSPWYPASSLRLVEPELKIGDHVRVIGQPFGYAYKHQTGQIDRIRGISSTGSIDLEKEDRWYKADALRKLTPEEIARHTGTVGYKMQECSEEIEKAKEAMQDLLAPLVDKRFESLEESLQEMDEYQTAMRDNGAKRFCEMSERLNRTENRLAILEGERPEAMDREQIQMPKNASISMRSDANGKITIDYSDGGFELAKSVLDSMKGA